MSLRLLSLLLLAGCPYLGDSGYTERVRDLDGDGFVGERFGGPDCRDDDPSIGDCDADGDGFLTVAAGGIDCDDDDASVHPEAPERCDGVDNDCDGLIDNDDPDAAASAPTIYADLDRDGYGDEGSPRGWCHPDQGLPSGFVVDGGDCDDRDASIAPGVPELCDDIDRNCDGDPIAGAEDLALWYADDDGDGFGREAELVGSSCTPLPDTARQVGDCDDADPGIFPGADEVPYDGIDQDCADGDLVDVDGDGFAAEPFGTDCNDDNVNVMPGAIEVCNLRDDDCDGEADEGIAIDYFVDADGDGQGEAGSQADHTCVAPSGWVPNDNDCDDSEPGIYVGALEICDDRDNDCDGATDEDDDGVVGLVDRYDDLDGDTYGDPAAAWRGCEIHLPTDRPDGSAYAWVTNDFDCADDDAAVFPGRQEECNGVDDDCDTLIDEQAIDQLLFYEDNDGDGFGNDAAPVYACPAVAGEFSRVGGDCNDADEASYPGAPEICGDAYRQDCSTADPYDCDADGFVDVAFGGDDCDDEAADANPDGQEVCDGLDNDCDGLFDGDDPSNDPSTVADWFLDADGDGVAGNIPVVQQACAPVPGAAIVRGDCDESDPTVYPEAPELCDGLDNDCDGVTDEAVAEADATKWYIDADGDGFGSASATWAHAQCEDPGDGSVADNTDCRDGSAAVRPDAVEICDGIDNDCDGLVDEADDSLVPDDWFVDDDGDGWGADATVIYACEPPPGYIAEGGDCDDGRADKSPSGIEVCDGGIDNDCDGLVDDNDDSLQGSNPWFVDADGDGFVAFTDTDGDGEPDDLDGDGVYDEAAFACLQPAGYDALVVVFDDQGQPDGFANDCNDASFLQSPGATEVCDAADVDEDCDGLADDDDDSVAFTSTWYLDVDGDGVGGGAAELACDAPSVQHRSIGGDCADDDARVSPFASEVCDTIDNDCDSLTDDDDPSAQLDTWYSDGDGDGWGDQLPNGAPVDERASCASPGPGGWVQVLGDCDPVDVNVNDGASEVCDGRDTDCNGLVDDISPSAGVWVWPDLDLDGYGDSSSGAQLACPAADRAPQSGDCDDTRNDVNPLQTERCNGRDDDCDGLVDAADPSIGDPVVDYAPDADGDNHGDLDLQLTACVGQGPAGWMEVGMLSPGDDCDDGDPAVRPGATETCNDRDDDCNGQIDDDYAVDAITWYVDDDGDGYGTPGGSITQCDSPGPTYAQTDTDCDDSRSEVSPSNPVEFCSTPYDDNCNGTINEADAVDAVSWFVDDDGDGYGSGFVGRYCADNVAGGLVDNDGDCDDSIGTGAAVNPGAFETCDRIDNDCDGFVDDDDSDVLDAVFVYLDGDNDGVGDGPLTSLAFCYPDEQPFYAEIDGDCDDDDPDQLFETNWYLDGDGDGVAGSTSTWPVATCDAPAPGAHYLPGDDCDDANDQIYPGRVVYVSSDTELTDAIDNACIETTIDLGPFTFTPPFVPNTSIFHLRGEPGTLFQGSLFFQQPAAGTSVESVEIRPFVGTFGLEVSGGQLVVDDVLIDGKGQDRRGIYLRNDAFLDASNVTIFDLATVGQQGAALWVDDAALVTQGLHIDSVDSNTLEVVFVQSGSDWWSNGDTIEGSTGGAFLTAWVRNSGADLRDLVFVDNDGSLTLETDAPGETISLRRVVYAFNRGMEVRCSFYPCANPPIFDIDNLLSVGNTGQASIYLNNAELDVSNATFVGNTRGLRLETNYRVTLTHLAFADQTVADIVLPAYWFPQTVGWNYLRTDDPGWSSTCADPGTCSDGPLDLLTYHPDLNPDLWLLYPRPGGTLYDRDPTSTDDDGSPRDIGYTGGPFGDSAAFYADSDSDGLPDGWEYHWLKVAGQPTNLATLDQGPVNNDSDDWFDDEEFLQGTNPFDGDTDGDGVDDVSDQCPLDPTTAGPC